MGDQPLRRIRATHQMAETAIELDWNAPVGISLRIDAGKPAALEIQGRDVELPQPKSVLDWAVFRNGRCGIVSRRQRVVFTRAFLLQ